MSLAINVDDVIGVLLADGWHDVVRGTFYYDAWELFTAVAGYWFPGESREHMWPTGATWKDPTGITYWVNAQHLLGLRGYPSDAEWPQ